VVKRLKILPGQDDALPLAAQGAANSGNEQRIAGVAGCVRVKESGEQAAANLAINLRARYERITSARSGADRASAGAGRR
jgi:hypothetical protein